MLGLARGITLGVDVGNLFQFERAIHGNRIMNRASEKKKIMRPHDTDRPASLHSDADSSTVSVLAGQLKQFANVCARTCSL